MKKLCLFIILIFGCGEVGEQIIGYEEIVQSGWELFSDEDFEQARTEFTNALDYEVLNNIAEAHIGIGWCNLYIANQYTDLIDFETQFDLELITSDDKYIIFRQPMNWFFLSAIILIIIYIVVRFRNKKIIRKWEIEEELAILNEDSIDDSDN